VTLAAVFGPLVVAAAIIAFAPLLLSHGSWRIRHPRAALRAWLAAITLGGVALIASLAAALIEITSASSRHTGEWIGPIALTLFGWVGLASVGGLVALALARYEPISAAERRATIEVLLVSASSTYRRDCLRGVDVSFIESDAVAAASTRANGRQIIVSRRLEQTLDAAQLRAVLEHERAHLIDGHDRIVRLARLNLACFPLLLGARTFESNARLLIELAADDQAARRCGARACAEALDALTTLTGDESLTLRALRLRGGAARATTGGARSSAAAASSTRRAPMTAPLQPPRSAD
jgi:Zn-dependent protease with chaperone function